MNPLKTGKLISDRRKELNMTQKELANKLFISDKAVSKWERGLSFPDIASLIPLSEILNVNLYDLLKGEETKDKKDDTLLKETISYSNEERSKLKKVLIAIIILMSIIVIFLLGILIIAYWPHDNIIYDGTIRPGEKISENDYVKGEKIATKELDDGWVCTMTVYYDDNNDENYFYNCLNIKHHELKGFNYYNLNNELNKYYISDTNFPSYTHNISYNDEINKINKYLKEKKFNKKISLEDLNDLELKYIDKKVLLELFNETRENKNIDTYGNYPMASINVFNYQYTSYETGETYVVGYYLDGYGYIRDVYIDIKIGEDYLSDLVKKDQFKNRIPQYNKLQTIKDYVLKNQVFRVPEELKNDRDGIELTKYNFYVINLLINSNNNRANNVIRYVTDEEEMVNQQRDDSNY